MPSMRGGGSSGGLHHHSRNSSAGSSSSSAPPPPITVVTMAPSSSSSSGYSHRREQKTNAPTILLKPPQHHQQQPQKLNNVDGMATNPISSSHNSYSNNSNNSNNDLPYNNLHNAQQYHQQQYPYYHQQQQQQQQQIFTTEKDDRDIDSALLSALRDKRERMALLRLEQHLIDFMNEKACGFMEVGGPFNNTIIRGASGGNSGSSGVNTGNNCNGVAGSDQDGGAQQQHQQQQLSPHGSNSIMVGTGGSSGNGLGGPTNMTTLMDTSNHSNTIGNGREGRQTSFQRKCLHKLADRFNIVRQSNNGNSTSINNSGSPYGGVNMNLIRLVKVKESRIPTVKLIDLDMSNYETSNLIPQDRGMGGIGGVTSAVGDSSDGTGADGYTVRGITDRLGGTHLDCGNGSTTNSGKKSRKKEKVKIMKRSPNSSSGSLNKNSDSGTSKRRGKKLLSDKEKAYAEARARIFNTQESSSSNLDGSEHANNSTINENNLADASTSVNPLESAVSAVSGSPDHHRSSPISPTSTGDSRSQSNNANTTNADSTDYNDDININVPAAAKGGAESKVLWRNRQQEASDPDFRRAHHPIMVQQPMYQTYSTNHVVVAAPAPYVSGYHQYPMSYSRNGQHAGYYQHHNDVSWQRQDGASMHQTHNAVHYNNSYAPHHYDGGMNNNEEDKRKQQTPVYTEEEFPALG